MVWDIIKNSLPEYKNILLKVLPNIDDFKEVVDEVLDSKFYNNLNYLKK